MAEVTREAVRNWVAALEYKTFYYRDILDGNVSPAAQPSLRSVVSALKREGFIEDIGKRQGNYRQVENSLPEINWWEGEAIGLPLILPMGIHEYCYFFPPCLVIAAGSPNQGKTAFMMNVVRLNYDWIETYFYVSEGKELLKKRFQSFIPPIPTPPPFHTKPMPQYPADAIIPDALNVLDYIEPDTEGVFRVADTLKAVLDKLGDKGIAVVALQKPFNRLEAYGGTFTQFKPALYVAIDKGVLQFVRAKVPKESKPNIYETKITFRIKNGIRFDDVNTTIG